MKSLMKSLIEIIFKHSWAVIIGYVFLSVALVLGAMHIKQDNSTEGTTPKEAPIVKLNTEIDQTFGSSEATIAVLEGDIWTADSLNRLRAITRAIKNVAGIDQVTSITNVKKLVEQDGFLVSNEMFNKDNPSPQAIKAAQKYMISNYSMKSITLVSRDGRQAVIVMTNKKGADGTTLANGYHQAIKNHWTGKYEMTGSSVVTASLSDVIGQDLPILGAASAVLLLLCLLVNFRSLYGVVLPLTTVVFGVLWGLGIFGWLGGKLQALTVIAPIAVMAVGSSFSLHLLGRLYFELANGKSKQEAIRTTFSETGQGVLISGIAIVAAMMTFLLSQIEMTRGLGVLTASGVFGSLVASVLLLPALLNVLPVPVVKFDPEAPSVFGNLLRGLAVWVARYKIPIFTGSLLLLIVSAIGATRIVPNTNVMAFFPKTSPIVTGINKIEEVFGGSTSLSLRVEGNLQDPKVLEGMLALQEEAKGIAGVGTSQSFATVMRSLHETISGEASLPKNSNTIAQETLLLNPEDIAGVVTADYKMGLISFTVKTLSTAEIKQVGKQLETLAEKHLGNLAKYTVAGQAYVSLAAEAALLHDFIISVSLSILLVILIDSFVRSFKAAVVTILSLVITIALQYGVLGWLGIELNLATMLMGALALGVGDYAIHLTVRYLEELRAGHQPEYAMSQAMFTSGRSISFTALTLGAGFLPLAFASFVPVSTLGILMVFTVMIVGLASLTLLPAACLIFLRSFGSSPVLVAQSTD
jgi:uncharacterized protein